MLAVGQVAATTASASASHPQRKRKATTSAAAPKCKREKVTDENCNGGSIMRYFDGKGEKRNCKMAAAEHNKPSLVFGLLLLADARALG